MLTRSAPLARTPLHPWHAAHGARFAERDGWQVVAGYGDAGQESEAARSGLGLADVSAFAKLSLRGPEVSTLARALVPDDAASEPRGVAAVPPGPALACRPTDDHLLVLAASPSAAPFEQRIAALCDGRAVVRADVTSALAGFHVLGPRSEELLRRLTHFDLRPASFPANACAETALAGVAALLVRTAGALRIYVDWDVGEYVWERLLQAGRDLHIKPVGLDALAPPGASR
jgi:heterotetrameric sarcosine oxidase gamma subunit